VRECFGYIQYRTTHLTVILQRHPNAFSLSEMSQRRRPSPQLTQTVTHVYPLTDSYETIVKRIRGAVTDFIPGITFDPVERPGTSNLLTILCTCAGEGPTVLAERYARSNHGLLKKDAAEAVEEALRRPRAEFARLREDRTFLAQVARDGAEKAQEHPDEIMREVRRRIGLS
jgi:tryptophanyl-tRNA synthetase